MIGFHWYREGLSLCSCDFNNSASIPSFFALIVSFASTYLCLSTYHVMAFCLWGDTACFTIQQLWKTLSIEDFLLVGFRSCSYMSPVWNSSVVRWRTIYRKQEGGNHMQRIPRDHLNALLEITSYLNFLSNLSKEIHQTKANHPALHIIYFISL